LHRLRRDFDAIEEDEGEEEEEGDDEVYGGVLDRSRFHPARYESKGETREEIFRRRRGGGAASAAEFTSEVGAVQFESSRPITRKCLVTTLGRYI
jgi:hypothetical protein